MFQQVTYILAFSELYFSSIYSLMQERQTLRKALEACGDALSDRQRPLLVMNGAADQLDLLDRLSRNLKKEHVLRLMLNYFVWARLLSAVQTARMAGGVNR